MFDEAKPVSVWENLVRTIIGFPKYLLEWTIGLVIAVLSDLHITTLALTGIVSGLALSSVLWGVVVFFGLYSLSRVVALLSNAVGFGFQGLARATSESGYAFANVFTQAQEQHVDTVERPGDKFDG